MKKLFTLTIALGALLISGNAFAQEEEKSTMFNGSTNIQVFYDFGSDRKNVTTTLEGFYQDPWGDTFFFIDYDFNAKKDATPGSYGSYMEISRGINFWQNTALAPISAHVELNAGVNFHNINWLFGLNWFVHSKNFKNTFTFELMYKTFKGSSSDLPMQFTFVWGLKDLFGAKGLTFSGFADIWGENGYLGSANDRFVFLSEPQLWYSVGQFFGCKNLNIGGEVELSCNFAGVHGFMCRPCAGVKWVF